MAPQPHEGKTDTQNIDIEIDFVAQEPPEAVLRLLDEFIHRMTPVPVKEKTMSDALKTTGNGGIALIKQYEGLRLTTYKDAVGIPTIGYGHVENPIPPGGTRTITAEDAEQILREDLQRFEHDVNNMLTVEVTQNQFDAP